MDEKKIVFYQFFVAPLKLTLLTLPKSKHKLCDCRLLKIQVPHCGSARGLHLYTAQQPFTQRAPSSMCKTQIFSSTLKYWYWYISGSTLHK